MADRRAKSGRVEGKDELFFSGPASRAVSPLNTRVWMLLLLASGACLAAWGLQRFMPSGWGAARLIPVGLAALVGWGTAVRLLFIQTRARVFWLIWLVAGLIPLADSVRRPGGLLVAVVFSAAFLIFRRYRPYGHLTPRRQAALTAISLVLFVLLAFFWKGRGPALATGASPGGTLSLFDNAVRYSLASLRWFWFLSLFHLVFTVRLHFMRLRPKLAVAAFFIAVVPILLLVSLAVGAVYMTLSESHAARARSVLEEWANLAGQDESFLRLLSKSAFGVQGVEPEGAAAAEAGQPPRLDSLARSLGAEGSPLPSGRPSSASFYFLRRPFLWLVCARRSSGGELAIRGAPVDQSFLTRLADTLHSDVVLTSGGPFRLDLGAAKTPGGGRASMATGKPPRRKGVPAPRAPAVDLRSSYGPVSGSTSFWSRPIYFGVTELPVFTLADGQWTSSKLYLQTPRSLRVTWGELFSASNPLGFVVLAVLGASALVFLVFEGLALAFGLRISGGITRGIRTLHRHLRRVAEGDLETRIEIPNQDELGDLAASFNQMTAAIKQGREEAIAREKLEKELETARQIQERLLPHQMPKLPGFEVSGTSLPSHEVGGDYFDFLELDTGRLGVAIADVAGKGIPAALLMANLQASLRAQDLRPESVSAIASRLNGILVKNTDERMFVTLFCGVLDRMSATFTYTNAGHNPPILLRADGRLERLEQGGLLLGFLSGQSYVQAEAALEPGDLLVLFTDGITEAVDPQAEGSESRYFGEEKLIQVLRANASGSVAEIQAAVLSAVATHTRQSPQGDDITLVVIKRTGGREALAYVS
jgi:serine phosphatase RsbU (regulator of sigma subunit)